MIREPAVAGAFYDSNVKHLRDSIEDCFKHRLGPGEIPKLSRINKEKKVNAIMVPHAGYVYSGQRFQYIMKGHGLFQMESVMWTMNLQMKSSRTPISLRLILMHT